MFSLVSNIRFGPGKSTLGFTNFLKTIAFQANGCFSESPWISLCASLCTFFIFFRPTHPLSYLCTQLLWACRRDVICMEIVICGNSMVLHTHVVSACTLLWCRLEIGKYLIGLTVLNVMYIVLEINMPTLCTTVNGQTNKLVNKYITPPCTL